MIVCISKNNNRKIHYCARASIKALDILMSYELQLLMVHWQNISLLYVHYPAAEFRIWQ